MIIKPLTYPIRIRIRGNRIKIRHIIQRLQTIQRDHFIAILQTRWNGGGIWAFLWSDSGYTGFPEVRTTGSAFEFRGGFWRRAMVEMNSGFDEVDMFAYVGWDGVGIAACSGKGISV